MPAGAEVAHLLIICLLAGILAQVLSGLFRLPSILFLLALGVAMGPSVAGLIDPGRLGTGLEALVRLSVALILFEGGMSLRLRDILKVQVSVRRLITIGVLITFVTASAAAHWILGAPLRQALLFGSLVTVTGPTVIRPLVQRIRMRPEIAAILEAEGILADPIGAILAAVCLEYALSPETSALLQFREFGIRIGAGLAVGAFIGAAAGLIVKYRAPSIERIKPLVVLSCALGCYGLAEMVRHESGIMAVVVAGLVMQYGLAKHDREVREFKELLTTLLLSILFILLAANLRKERMLEVGWQGLAVVLTVMLVIRPLNIFLSTAGGNPTFREKLFLSWVAPRGIVAAAVASLGAMVLEREGHAGAHQVESLVFLTIVLTVFLQGSTAQIVAWVLGITVKEPRSIIIIGANAIGLAIARAYASEGRSVTVVDRNRDLIDALQIPGIRGIPGDATDREILHLAGLDDADILIALTPSTTVNQTTAQNAYHERHLEQVRIALDENDRMKLDPVLDRAGAEIAFGRPIPFDIWQHQLENGRAGLIEVDVHEQNAPRKPVGELIFANDAVPLYLRRSGRAQIVSGSTRFQPGDRLTLLARSTDPEKLRATLGVESTDRVAQRPALK